MSEPGRPRQPASSGATPPRQELNGCVYAGCMFGSLPIAAAVVIAGILGVYVLVDRLVALVPERAASAVIGLFLLLLGGWTVVAIVAGRSPSGTSRSARLLAIIVGLGIALLGVPLLAFGLGILRSPADF